MSQSLSACSLLVRTQVDTDEASTAAATFVEQETSSASLVSWHFFNPFFYCHVMAFQRCDSARRGVYCDVTFKAIALCFDCTELQTVMVQGLDAVFATLEVFCVRDCFFGKTQI